MLCCTYTKILCVTITYHSKRTIENVEYTSNFYSTSCSFIVLFTLTFIPRCLICVTNKTKFFFISICKIFSLLEEVADIIPFMELCPHFCQLPSKQAVICDRSSFSFSATVYLAVCIMEYSLISNTAEPAVLL